MPVGYGQAETRHNPIDNLEKSMGKKVQFTSRIGLIAATVGSAVGLGNIWRFPAEVQQGGGAAFLAIYVLCVIILGIPVMLAEFTVGRAGRSDAIGAFRNLGAARPWWFAGMTGLLASYLILCFYMVVAGWTLEYLWQSLTGDLYNTVAGTDSATQSFDAHMTEYIGTTWPPLISTFILIAVNLGVLLMGVQKGIERASNILMPLLFAILVVFCCFSLTLPGASDGLHYFLNPDFSKVTTDVVLSALGQAFFSLSLGMGILITFASYYPRTANLTRTAATVSALDLMVSLLMGFIIFPAVMTFGLDGESTAGATLVFVTLPEIFAQMPGTQVWSSLFFVLLLVAALTSTISISEVSIKFMQDRFGLTRTRACMAVILPLFVFSTICSLSNGVLSDVRILGMNIFDLLDNFATNILLPLTAIGTCLYVGWGAPEKLLWSQLTNDGTIRNRLYRPIRFTIRYIAPILIGAVLVWYFIKG